MIMDDSFQWFMDVFSSYQSSSSLLSILVGVYWLEYVIYLFLWISISDLIDVFF